jgi:hypothetical protein
MATAKSEAIAGDVPRDLSSAMGKTQQVVFRESGIHSVFNPHHSVFLRSRRNLDPSDFLFFALQVLFRLQLKYGI